MSRIGKKPIDIPTSVSLNLAVSGAVSVKGPRGQLVWTLPKGINGRIESDKFLLIRVSEDRKVRALHGLARALISNMVTGVNAGFTRDLEIHGVGFKATVQGEVLNLSLGFSHPIHFSIPGGIKVTVSENTKVKIEGIDRQLVGQVAADIRGYYPPEPYKGKGVRYVGEKIQRKEGKTVQ